jgi:hypothetical protein
MPQNFEFVEWVVVLASPKSDPALLSPDFLLHSGIVPADWVVSKEPVRGSKFSQVSYQNGVSVVARAERMAFVEPLKVEKTGSEIPGVVERYLNALPNLDYQGVGLNFQGYAAFLEENDTARKFLFSNVLSGGSWQQLGNAPAQAVVNLTYMLEDTRLNLAIREAALQKADQVGMPIVLQGKRKKKSSLMC